ncbi:MAG: virulence-associated E family protein [Lachnospiraceae bacterium]|nr:virulence-associated E family protein [Lachnospiraceae bacterium]
MDKAEIHLLENEPESRAYMLQMWAEAMEIYRKKDYELKFPERLEAQLLEIQKECMPDDSIAGIIQIFLD